MIIDTNYKQLEELSAIEKLWHMNVDGIVLVATELTMAHHTLAKKLDIPFVVLGQEMKDGYSIINDDYEAGFEVGRYAGKMNHQKIIYLGVNAKDEAVGYIRKKGVLDGLKQSGIENVKVVETDFAFDKTRKVVHDFLNRELPSLIICATDNIALAPFKELKEAHVQVPQTVSLIGFGGYEISKLITPSLCTICFDNEQAGMLAGISCL